jgi:hemoglobin
MKDISTKEDVKLMVDSFYELVQADDLLSPIFTHIAHVNWDLHVEKMYKFWGTMLLGEMSYKGSAYTVHEKMPISTAHFDRWLSLFDKSIDAHFAGVNTEDAKKTAKTIGMTFQAKMGLYNK